MLGVSGLITNDGAATVAESGGARSGSSEVCASAGMGEIERSGGCGSRWPRQETLALLKIRSAMDVAFRDASLKGPLWEEVSRKMGELGFQRSAKKCKEKFENVYKYHKRTKDGRSSKPDGKNYRFFDQLAALKNAPPPPCPQPPATTIMAAPPNSAVPKSHDTISSTSPTPLSVVPPEIITNPINSSSFQPPLMQPPFPAHQCHGCHLSHRPISTSPASNTKSFSTSSDEDIRRRQGRKRKWKDYFERLMKDVVQKQEELQKKLLEAWEKREKDRIAREEAWRVQEMARMNREYDNLVADRSIAAVKDVAVIAFLQKVTMQVDQEPENPHPPQLLPPPPPPPPQPQQSALPPPPELPAQPPPPTKFMEMSNRDNGSSRWPKAEVEALIKIRTGLDVKYHDNGPKGPLWEEISKSMAKLGYKRNAKRCKEKWENINKYFKKVKESNKKRPEDAKTCPYFHQLDAIYREKAKNNLPLYNPGYGSKPNNPIMARPDQQKNNPVLHDGGHDNDTMQKDDQDEEDEVREYEIEAAIFADKLDEVRATGSCG